MLAKTKSVDMCNGPLLGKIVFFTIPIILSGLLQLLFNAADTIVVGRYGSETSLAAVGSTGSITTLLTNLFMGFSMSSGITISHAIGARKYDDIHEIVHTSVIAGLISGIFVGIIGIIFTPMLLKAMDSPTEVIGQSALYLRIIFLGMPANMVYNFGASMLRATGETKKPLYYLTFAGIVNVILNLILVIYFNMDVAGVAIATITAQTISAVLVIRNLTKGNEFFKLSLKEVKIYKDKLIKIITIGLPAGVQSSLFSISNVLIQTSINSFGSVVMSGNAAAASIEGFVYVAMNAFYQTSMTFAGQNMGAKKYSRITKSMGICLILVTAVGVLLGAIAYGFGEQLLAIYCPGKIEDITYGLSRLAIVGRFYFLCGMMEVIAGTIRGMGYSFSTMIVSLIGACALRIVWIYTIFAYYGTLTSLYLSYIASWILVFAVDMIIYFWLRKNLQKYELKAE